MKFLLPEQFTHKLNQIFDEVKFLVVQVLPNAEVEHIGSSAIKNVISKGDLDILVRVEPNSFEDSLLSIQKLGFKIKEGTP